MRDWIALRSVLVMLAVFGVVMLALWAMIAVGFAALWVPTPENTAEQLLKALKAHRYAAARDLLSEDLRQKVGEAALREITLAIERTNQGIDEAHGRGGREDKETATAAVAVKQGNGREQVIEFPLRKEHGLWRLSALDPLRRLGG